MPMPEHGRAPEEPSHAIWTLPNLLSFARLAGIPLFLWLLLGPKADLAALGVLIFSGISDWADGVLARSLHQVTRLGRLLDPLADRLYIVAALAAFVAREIVPWWFAAAVIGRDLLLALTLPLLRRAGYTPLQVSYVGKAATLCLLASFPGLLLASAATRHTWGALHDVALPIAWGFALWGVALYWVAASGYARQTWALWRARQYSAGISRP
jgi:cardiolipin synthase